MSTMMRKEVYAAIKECNLQDACLERFGKNFTVCGTADLISLLEERGSLNKLARKTGEAKGAEAKKPKEKCGSCNKPKDENIGRDSMVHPSEEINPDFSEYTGLKKAMISLAWSLLSKGVITIDEYKLIKDYMDEASGSPDNGKLGEDEIQELFGFAR